MKGILIVNRCSYLHSWRAISTDDDQKKGNVIIIGTLYKNQQMKPNILKELSEENQDEDIGEMAKLLENMSFLKQERQQNM